MEDIIRNNMENCFDFYQQLRKSADKDSIENRQKRILILDTIKTHAEAIRDNVHLNIAKSIKQEEENFFLKKEISLNNKIIKGSFEIYMN